MELRSVILIVGVGAVLSSCASVSRGSKENFTISTDPSGASATFSDGYVCTTPCSMQRKHKVEFTITLEKEGYKTVDLYIDSRAHAGGAGAATAGNALLGGLVGFGVDALTGAMKKLAPNPAHVVMEPGEGYLRLAAQMGTEDITEVPDGADFKDYIKKRDVEVSENTPDD